MIVCKKCGHRNNDTDQWCTNPACGAYLAFEGQTGDTDTVEQPVTGPPTTPPPPPPPSAPPSAPPPPPPPPPPRPSGSEIPPIRPGEVVCPTCHWGNDPSRSFCRHCGGPLTDAGTTWQSRGTKEKWTGDEPKRRWPLILAAGLGAVVFAGAGALAVHLIEGKGSAGETGSTGVGTAGPTVDGTALGKKDFTVKATTSEGDAGPEYLVDGDPDSYWAARPSGDENTKLTFSLKDEARIVRLEVDSGGVEGQYDRRPRPAAVCLYLDGGDCQRRELLDQAETQEVRVDAPGPITDLEIEVLTVYPPKTGGNNDVAVRELTLYAE